MTGQSARKRVADRRARNLELGRLDVSRRCAACKRALPATGAWQKFDGGPKYCSRDCYDDAKESRGEA